MKYWLVWILTGMIFLYADVVDIPTRGVSERAVVLMPEHPKAAVILFAGGHGGLQIKDDETYGWGGGNFLVRARNLFVEHQMMVVIIDAPSDHQSAPFLANFRQTKEHVQDIQALVEWVKTKTDAPIWLVGTSRGTQSVAYAATHGIQGVHGIVLTSTILTDSKVDAVPEMPLEKITLPLLVVHHENDGCMHCSPTLLEAFMKKLPSASLIMMQGGKTQGDPCLAMAYHGFNGVEKEVVDKISDWIVAH